MKNFNRLINIFFIGILYLYVLSGCSETVTITESTCGSCMSIDLAELAKLEQKAANNDLTSVVILVNHYLFDKDHQKEYHIWLNKAAELGDEQSQYNLATWFLIIKYPRDEKKDCESGLYWLKKAAAQNDQIWKNPDIGVVKAILSCDWHLPEKER